MKKFCGALLLWSLSLAGVNESVRPQIEPTIASRAQAIPSEEDEPAQEATRAESRLYFPDYVDGGGWSVQLAISNVARRATAAVVVTAYDQDGQRLPELFDSETTFEIPPLGSRVLKSPGTGEIRRGWIEVQSVPPSVSGLLTYRHSGSGVEVGVAPVLLGDGFALFVEESSGIGTGLAIFKPEADSEVEFRLRDESGTDPFGQDLLVGDFQQQARTLPEWFNPIGATFPGEFRGLLFLRSGEDSSFAPLGLRFGKRKTSLSAVPGIPFLGEGGDGIPNPFQTTTSTAVPLYFPDYVDGGGWSVQLVLGNLDPDRSVLVEVEVYDQQGRSAGGLFDSAIRFELPAQGSQVLSSAGGTRIRRGWIKVEADSASVRGLLVYRHTETGIEVGVAPVEPRNEFALFVEETSEIGTGLALFKPEMDSKVELRIRDEAGNDPLGDVYVPWRNFRQTARTLSEWFDVDGVETGFLKNFRGLLFLRTEDGSEFAPLGLRFGKETSALSAVPGIGIVDGVRIAGGVGSDGGVEIDGGVGIDGGGQAPPPTVTLSVSPSSIDRGQSTTLRWSSTNAKSVEITPDVGKVSTSGTTKVSPRTTTTYRITVTAADGQKATATVTVTVAITDRAVLEALYEATDGPNWVNNENWMTDAPLGEWYGVESDSSGRVVGIRLGGTWEGREQVPHGLLGPIPPELGNLSSLEVLDLGINSLTGTMPPELGNLSNLEVLNLRFNRLIGVIPSGIGGLANLRELNLRQNLLTGTMPPELGRLANLEILNLENNELTGPIPPEFRALASLHALDVGWNSLSGPIPPWLGDLTKLWELSLRVNDFVGPIPPELGNLDNLGLLLLDKNNLSGPIPPELGNLTNVGLLFLYDNGLTGPIPPELGNITRLRHLGMWGNNLTGPIPPELGNLSNLTGLSLSSNSLTGRVPDELGNLHNLRDITLSDNLLTGSLPLSFLGLSKLETFGCRRTTGVCVPATDEFREWVRQVEVRGNIALAVDIPFCDEIDVRALEALYEATNGADWTSSDGWLEDENLGRWHGVMTDSVGRVSVLDLTANGLSGYVPQAIGLLANMTELRLGDNALAGRLPLSLTDVPLEEFNYGGTSLCLADDDDFRDWVNGIPRHSGTSMLCPPLTDREILEWLYRNTDGPSWNQSDGWLTDAPLARWYGVETDASGRVVELRLRFNRLSGLLPAELGELSQLRILDLRANGLSGSIPPELGGLANLTSLDLSGNRLVGSIPEQLGQLSDLEGLMLCCNELSGSIPRELGGLANLTSLSLGWNQLVGAIPPELGGLVHLNRLELNGNFLSGPVPPELGGLRSLQRLDLTGNHLGGHIPSELGKLAAMDAIRLADNGLTGGVPSQFGALERLWELDLSGNQLAGPIPSELGGLRGLSELRLFGNALSGSIPAELGDLASLTTLNLSGNQLSGAIPGELGHLAKLTTLNLGDNKLSGPLPSELGHAAALESLDLRSNALAGPVPTEFGNLKLLRSLILADNPELKGPLPPGFPALERIELLMAGGTELCRPADSRFDAWFRSIVDRRLVRCPGGAAAYLTQTVQSWDEPVPLLAGEPALLRVFVTAPQGATATMPSVRATFYVNGTERHSTQIHASAQTIPSEVIEDDLALSANVEIPDWVIVPGLEMVIQVDPEGILDSALGVTKRIPDSGRLTVDVRTVPPLRLTLIPFLSETEPDSSVIESVAAMATDPDGHELLRDARTLLPIAEFAVETHEPVTVATPNPGAILAQVQAMRIMEGGSGYWMGIWDGRLKPGAVQPAAVGIAFLDGSASMSVRNPGTIAHELGHNLSLQHAPCGSPDGVDPWFPHYGGSIGAWGYDFGRNILVTPQTADVMSYCTHGAYWISDFFFNKALRQRLAAAEAGSAASGRLSSLVATPAKSLLLWGGVDASGTPFLEPAFIVKAPASLPRSTGEYEIIGRNSDGDELFSLTFEMPEIADGDGRSSFAFALPVQPEWADELAGITLSGPGGSVTLDQDTDRPVTILRNPQTGQIRAILRGAAAVSQNLDTTVSALSSDTVLERLTSRGIPDPEDWSR